MADDLDDLMAELGASQVAGRTPLDRYREFRQVFLGTDAGKRVMHDILTWGHVWKSTAVKGDPHETYLREGERNMALKLITTIQIEPRTQPTEQQRTAPEEN